MRCWLCAGYRPPATAALRGGRVGRLLAAQPGSGCRWSNRPGSTCAPGGGNDLVGIPEGEVRLAPDAVLARSAAACGRALSHSVEVMACSVRISSSSPGQWLQAGRNRLRIGSANRQRPVSVPFLGSVQCLLSAFPEALALPLLRISVSRQGWSVRCRRLSVAFCVWSRVF